MLQKLDRYPALLTTDYRPVIFFLAKFSAAVCSRTKSVEVAFTFSRENECGR